MFVLFLYSQADIEETVRKSTTSLLSKTFSSRLSSLFQKPNLTLSQVTQIIVDTGYLEKSSIYLEEFVSNITGWIFTFILIRCSSSKILQFYFFICSSNREVELTAPSDIYLFKAARDDAERQICEKLKNKIDEFLGLENYDWTLVEPQGHASSFITDLIAFLKTTFDMFTNLPVSIC